MHPPPLIAILAGGRSRRIGTDKAALPIGGTTWLAHIAGAARSTGCRVIVVGRAGHDEAADVPAEVAFVPDEAPGLGPMGGLVTALRYADAPVLLTGCDMPFLTTGAFGWLLDRIREGTGPMGLAVRTGTRLQPLFTGYLPAVAPTIDACIADGRLSLRRLLVEPAFRIVSAPDDVNHTLRNINTPEDRLRFGL